MPGLPVPSLHINARHRKAGLFLCAGIVEQKTHIKDITKLGGLIKTMPVTAVSFLLCAFSVMGIRRSAVFFSKYL